MDKIQVFLLVLASTFLGLFLYVLSPANQVDRIIPSDAETFLQEFSGSEDKTVTLNAVGDVMLGRSVMSKSVSAGDFRYPFLKTAERVQNADITVANLENPIIENCPKHDSGFKFCAVPEMLEGLTFAGIDIVSLANNHTLNYGREGFEETKKHLTERGIGYVGDGNLEVRNINGTSYGFLGFNLVDRGINNSELDLIKESANSSDVLAVMVHWGQEYKSEANSFQVDSAQKIVDAGADLIIGAHPHWAQNVEHIESKPVYYSLGNFVFDQMWSEETKKGIMVGITFDGTEIISETTYQIYMSSFAQPEFLQ
jgi:poly-gamma-glutamate capsule biosynthesis protein CapA/YwtB (metallophosphatase superfamily)